MQSLQNLKAADELPRLVAEPESRLADPATIDHVLRAMPHLGSKAIVIRLRAASTLGHRWAAGEAAWPPPGRRA